MKLHVLLVFSSLRFGVLQNLNGLVNVAALRKKSVFKLKNDQKWTGLASSQTFCLFSKDRRVRRNEKKNHGMSK